MNTDTHTKWFITGLFEYPDGTEQVETRYFWSSVADSEEEAIARFDNPIRGGEILEVFHIATQEEFFSDEETVDQTTPPIVTDGDTDTTPDKESETTEETTEETNGSDIIKA